VGPGLAMAWFSKEPPWEVRYAENIYDGMVVHNDIGDVTAIKLRMPRAAHRVFQDKLLLQRELICFVALMVAATPEMQLQPVIESFGSLIFEKASTRGVRINRRKTRRRSCVFWTICESGEAIRFWRCSPIAAKLRHPFK
jgi:hypothetical protein